MREGVWGRLGYGADGRNPPFSRAILHGAVIIDYLLLVVIFGVPDGCLRVVSRGGISKIPSGTSPGGPEGAFWEQFPAFEFESGAFGASNQNET